MGRKVEAPKDPTAPAYFVQYAALWCIMLAFFVTLLTMGKAKTAEFKKGIGHIRNAFGGSGGLGFMEFWSSAISGSMASQAPTGRDVGPDAEGDMVGYLKGMLWKEGLSSVSFLRVSVDNRATDVLLRTPVVFAEGESVIPPQGRDFLNKFQTLLTSLGGWRVEVVALARENGDERSNLELAAQRAVAVTRYLDSVSVGGRGTPVSVGYASAAYLGLAPGTEEADARQLLMFSLRRSVKRVTKQ